MSVIALLAPRRPFHRHLPGARTRGRQLPERRHLPPAGHARAAVARAVRGTRPRTQRRTTHRPPAPRRAASTSSCRARPARRARRPSRALQNIPLISWLVLRGRCANCGVRSASAIPLVELLTGALTAAVAWKFGFGWPARRRARADLVPDRPDLHRCRSPAAAGQLLPCRCCGSACSRACGRRRGRRSPARRPALEPHRSDGGLREPVERLSSVPAAHRQGRHGVR